MKAGLEIKKNKTKPNQTNKKQLETEDSLMPNG